MPPEGAPKESPAPADTPFRARLRLHQSWWRQHRLRVPAGTGPTRTSKRVFGHMLPLEAGEQGLNFLTPAIRAVFLERARAGGSLEPFRCAHNMLSSQPLCFNLFGPLVHDHALATRLLRALAIDAVDAVTDVRIEHAPEPAAKQLGDRTCFDAYVEYRRPDGELAFLGVETKLTEPFSPKRYDRPEYWWWVGDRDAPWRAEMSAHLPDGRWNQLWRDHMLVEAHRRTSSSRYAAGRLVLLHHPDDRSIEPAIAGYRALLRDPARSFVVLTFDRVVAAWTTALRHDHERTWLTAFRERYLDLGLSAAAWAEHRREAQVNPVDRPPSSP